MNYLLDTHALIWFLNGSKELSSTAKNAIESEVAETFVSIASIWEIAIKINLGRLEMDFPFEKLKLEIEDNGFQLLPLTFEDIVELMNLSLHHRDPFDRILISQAKSNNFTLISKDRIFSEYAVNLLW